MNCKFTNITAHTGYSNVTNLASFGNSYNGSAIYGYGYKTSFAINQSGFGITNSDPETFENCDYSIYADRISLITHNSKMKNVGTGVRAQLVKSGVNIYENKIDAREDGVQLLFCDGGGRNNEIWNNKILFGNNNNLTGTFAGILVEEDLNQNVYSRIHNNDIYFGASASARYGIFANSTVPFEITRNRISLANNSFDWDGIYMENCEKSNVSCNVISATGSLPTGATDPSAIKYFMGNGPTIACNAMDNTPNGIFVIGQINVTHNLELKFNEFNNHFIGLRYGANTIAAAQEVKGNLWFNAAPIGGIQARNDNTSSNFLIDYYSYANNPTPPTGATFLPSLIPTNIGWFVFDLLGSNESCYSPSNFCNNNFPIVNLNISELELKIAKDSIENNPYTEETRWMMKKGLYEKLYNNPELLSDSIMAAFYYSMQNSFIAQLKEIESAKSMLFLTDSTMNAACLQFEFNLDASRSQLMEQLGFLGTALENNGNTSSIVTSVIAIQASIVAIISSRDNLATLIDSQRIGNAENTRTANNQLTTSATIESNEKTVNEVSLVTIGKDNLQFTSNQIEILRNIANQCPLSGGSAVFRARAMLYLIEGKLDYHDRVICWSEGIELKEQQTETNRNATAKIYPNPANESVTIDYKFEREVKIEFTLYTSAGKQITNKYLSGGKNSYNFSTTQLLPGVYHVELKGSNIPAFNGKLIIIR